MNVSMGDAFNLGWKLASVLKGQSRPQLLRTYSEERQAVAQDLIDFDREWAAILSAKPVAGAATTAQGVSPDTFESYFIKSGRYTAGTAIHYQPSSLTAASTHQHLATGFELGKRFHSSLVTRLADGKPMQLGHTVQADARWRLFVFADEAGATKNSALDRLCRYLAEDPTSPTQKYTPADSDLDAVIDVRAIFQQGNRALEIADMPTLLLPRKGIFGLVDYEKIFTIDTRSGADIFETRGISRSKGCMVIVRPDQYTANILPLDATDELARYFDALLC